MLQPLGNQESHLTQIFIGYVYFWYDIKMRNSDFEMKILVQVEKAQMEKKEAQKVWYYFDNYFVMFSVQFIF